MTEEITHKTQGALRKEVYDFLKESGFTLTKDMLGKLSKLLQSVYEKRTLTSTDPLNPIETTHNILCQGCGGKRIVKGRGAWKRYRNNRDLKPEDIKTL